MITYSRLGSNGRLGNQMFQYAALFSLGLTRGYTIGIPKRTKLSEVFEIPSATQLEVFGSQKKYKEGKFEFDASLFLAPDNCDIDGYFQSGYYFEACNDLLLKEFVFKKHIQEKAAEYLSRFNGKDLILCSLHIRRGDYKNLSNYHTNLGADYYQKSGKILTQNISNRHILVFSDEPEWCKNVITGSDVTIVETNDDAVELCIMSKCQAHIIANSSFSWWGAWLSGSNAVIAPKNWFGPDGPKKWDSVYQNGWLLA
jgi:Glycosyl transferase family 11